MSERLGKDRIWEMLLAGTPARALDVVAMASPEDAADLREAREMMAALALSAPSVWSRPALRERLMATRPRARRPKRPAMLVLDMIQDHLTPGRPLEVPRAREIIPALKKRLADARAGGIPVIYICDTHAPDDSDFDEWPPHAIAGTPGSEPWPDLAPEPGDHIVRKRTYSAFTGTGLGELLDRLEADQIILTGCATEIGISVTATDALQRGFVVTIPPDSQAGTSPMTEMLTLANLSMLPPFEPRYLRRAER